MIALETTFLVDYLNGESATRDFLEPRAEQPFYSPSLALFEAYRGAEHAAGREGVEQVSDALAWIDPLALTGPAAFEAATLENELLSKGTPINLRDVLIAAVCRHYGARLVTRDADFENVNGLETIGY